MIDVYYMRRGQYAECALGWRRVRCCCIICDRAFAINVALSVVPGDFWYSPPRTVIVHLREAYAFVQVRQITQNRARDVREQELLSPRLFHEITLRGLVQFTEGFAEVIRQRVVLIVSVNVEHFCYTKHTWTYFSYILINYFLIFRMKFCIWTNASVDV